MHCAALCTRGHQVELAPSRNVDGTFEPGEGMYRGVRVKLVVATELLSQLGGLPTTPGALTGLPPPQVPPSLIPASPAVPTFVRGVSSKGSAWGSRSLSILRGSWVRAD